MTNTFDVTALETINSLEGRLQQIEFVITGGDVYNTTTTNTVDEDIGHQHHNFIHDYDEYEDEASIVRPLASILQRFSYLEHSFQQLISKKCRAFEGLLKLYSDHPYLFPSFLQKSNDGLTTNLDTAGILSIIKASASSYSETASRLRSVTDMAIPPADLSAQLISLQPRIAKIESIQSNQYAQVKLLRERSAQLIEHWYLKNILEMGETWATLEMRARRIEQKIRRAKIVKQKEEAI